MNKSGQHNKFRRTLAAAGILASLNSLGSQAAKTTDVNTFDKPDFAYPQTVVDNALPKLSEGNPIEKLRAAIQISIARNAVTPSEAGQRAEMLDSLATSLQSPYRELAYLLEAQLYASIYKSNSWTFDERKLSTADVPSDPMAWSGEIFSSHICELIKKATSNLETLDKTDISIIKPLLETASSNYTDRYPTVGAFVVAQAVDVLSPIENTNKMIPFGSSTAPKPENPAIILLDKEIAANVAAGRMAAAVEFTLMRADFAADPSAFLLSRYKSSFSAVPEGIRLLCAAVNSNSDTKEMYGLLSEAVDRGRGTEYAAMARATMCNLSAASASVKGRQQYLSSDSIKVNVSGANINKLYLLTYSLPSTLNNRNTKTILANGRRIGATAVELPGTIPFSASHEVTLPNPGYGQYAVIISSTEDATGILDKGRTDYPMCFTVSDMQVVKTSDGKQERLYVTNALNLAPVKGATVTLSPQRANKKSKHTLTTGKEGYVIVPDGSWNVVILNGKDRITNDVYNYFHGQESEKNTRLIANVLTSLSVYHPGDTVEFAAVISEINDRKIVLSSATPVTVSLRDPNWQICDSLTFTPEADGRIVGSFVIPTDRMLGRWSILVQNHKGNIGSGGFQVADYRAPTFFVDIDDIAAPTAGEDIIINGKALSYTGMPIANAEVKYDVTYASFWLWRGGSIDSYTATGTTDEGGNFTLRLGTDGLKDTPYACGGYSVTATVTSGAGETQTSDPKFFSLGESYSVDTTALPDRLEVKGEEVALTVPVTDIVRKRVEREVKYTATDGRNVLSGSFKSPTLRLPAASLPSGKYDFTFELENDTTKWNSSVVIYRADDRKAPYATPLWIPRKEIAAEAGAKSVSIPYATGFADGSLLCQVSDCNGLISEEWFNPGTAMADLKVKSPDSNNRVWVRFVGGHDLNIESATVTVLPSSERDSLTISAHSFRDRIVPGAKEQWRFGVKFNGKAADRFPVMAVMSDKSLNAITSFAWSLNPRASINFSNPTSIDTPYIYAASGNSVLSSCNYKGMPNFLSPEWNFYGQNLYSSYRGVRAYKSMARATATGGIMLEEAEVADAAAPMMVNADMVVNQSAKKSDEGASQNIDTSSIILSDNEHPLAFFRPSLTTGKEGEVAIQFEAPQFSTTWQLQLLTYTPELRTALRTFDIVAAKPVMVKANYPRFLRTGDRAQIAATLMNNSEKTRSVAGVIELFNPTDNKIVSRKEFPAAELASKGSRVVNIDYDVTDEIAPLGVRCYAISGDYTDGEQDLIGILPSSTPVTESTPFYLTPTQDKFEVKLPKFNSSAHVTLQYCDNPIWYFVTALPDITTPKSENIFSRLSALFGNAVSDALARRYPQIPAAIEQWKASNDPMLTSPLAANANLQATPWINNADAETRRMQQLTSLLDSAATSHSIASIAEGIEKLQREDGGWSWMPKMQSSLFVTSDVLLNIAWLREMNALPEGIFSSGMTSNGVLYCDKEYYDSYIKSNKQVSLTSALNWLYIRSYFDVNAENSKILNCLKLSLAKIEKEWRDLDIYGKATAALLLNREGKSDTARSILESIRQFGTVTPSSGMYFDNIGSGWNGYTRLQTTAQALTAFSTIMPDDSAVDLLRQWLIMQRQVQDWGYNNHTAAVVHAVLTSGTDWLHSAGPVNILLGNEPLSTLTDNLTGSFTINLDPKAASGKTLQIVRSSSQPAWGGVTSQYVAPIAEVKAASVPELSITKQIVPADGAVGEKVRVTLTVTNDRDLQYVEITDERGACLEPADQLSSYAVSDGVEIYRETRNDCTNLFISFLPKGVHQISYDCYIDREGTYTTGIATARSLYSPLVTAHSAGKSINVK